MNTCYFLSVLSFLLLTTAFVQSFSKFLIFNANHLTFMILTSIIYCATETLIIFFFVGTGVSIKEYTQAHNLKPDYHRNSISIKRRVYPPQMLNLLLMIILFILVGAVDIGKVPVWSYHVYFVICLLQYIDAKKIQHQCFRENTRNVLAMSGLKLGG